MNFINGINAVIKEKITQNREYIMKCKGEDEPHILVYDGIVDEVCYSTLKPKILFLLRDGNDPNRYEDGNGYTYRDLYETAIATTKNETKKTRLYTMWRFMCMWTRIIEEPEFTLDQCWNENQGFDVDSMRGYLRHIATVNIKKSAGKGTNDSSYASLLNNAVKEYYSLIKDEIALINPGIVICCGTFDNIVSQYNTEIYTLPNGKHYFIDNGCVYLEFWHPGARFGYKKFFSLFKETYDSIRTLTL